MAVVRAYTMEPREIEAFARLNREYLARTLRLARRQAALSPFLGILAGLGTLFVLWFGGKAVVEGRITLGAFVAFSGYLAYLGWPILALGWVLAVVRRGLAAMERVAELLRAEPAADPEPDAADAGGPPIVGDGDDHESDVRLWRRGRRPRGGAARGEPRGARRVLRGGGRAHGRREVHAGSAARPAVGAAAGHGVRGWPGRPGHPAGDAAARDRLRAAGDVPLLPLAGGERRARRARRRRRPAPGGRPRGRADRRRGPASRGVGHGGRRAGPHAVRRPAPAGRPGPRPPDRSADPGPGRRLRLGGRGDRRQRSWPSCGMSAGGGRRCSSRTGCGRRARPTGSWSWTRAGSWSRGPTTSWWRAAACTRGCGGASSSRRRWRCER